MNRFILPADYTSLLVLQNYMCSKAIQFLPKKIYIQYNPMSIARISKRFMFIVMCTFKSLLRLNSPSQSSHTIHISK